MNFVIPASLIASFSILPIRQLVTAMLFKLF